MILLSKNSAFTMQKDCFYTPKAMLFASGLTVNKKRLSPYLYKIKSPSIGYRKRLYLEIENILCSIYLHYVQDMNILAYLKGTCALRFRLLFL